MLHYTTYSNVFYLLLLSLFHLGLLLHQSHQVVVHHCYGCCKFCCTRHGTILTCPSSVSPFILGAGC